MLQLRAMESKNLRSFLFPLAGVLLVLGGLFYFAFVRIDSLQEQVKELSRGLASTTVALSEKTGTLSEGLSTLSEKATGLSDTLSTAEKRIEATTNNVEAVKAQVGGVEQTVGTLQKLSKTDPELLKKYSKVFFLNENYLPANLLGIDKTYLYSESRPEQIRSEIWPHLKSLLDDAKASNTILYVKSAYRSFGEQGSLKNAYSVTYGAGTANQFSADQGYSEHQLGTTIDLITTGLGGQLSGFEKTNPYGWLSDNAYRYGFILSYPKGNTYYVFEPWHWRYVGVALATFLHNQNLQFYDVDQRTIDGFLVNIFD